MYKTSVRGILIPGNKSYGQVANDILHPLEAKSPPPWWYIVASLAIGMTGFGIWGIYTTVTQGIGTWGVNNNVGWGMAIISFVWWIAIGHAGTAFSIFLLIMRQRWLTSITRTAEAMTVLAVICAGIFPLLHMGRIWNGFFILPYPNTRGPLWDNFNSPLFWDVAAISTYLMTSAVFWYIGLIPDLALVRERAVSKVKKRVYALLSFGWVGTARGWLRQETAIILIGGLAAPLVVSVHSIVSMDFATSVIPGWHTTIFPPYFVIGAIFSGFAMVMTLMIIIRHVFRYKDYVTQAHLDAIARIMVFISMFMGLAYATELFIAWYSAGEYEIFTFMKNRVTGTYTIAFWIMITCNAIIPQLFWSKRIRNNLMIMFAITIIINIGMWFERYVIIVTSISKDFLPSSWASYSPTVVEWANYIGTMGIFILGILLFFRYVPIIAMSETKGVLKETSNIEEVKHGNH
ncbi:MAG: polysulfide reductase NrfD [Bacteroidales bacterium]|nr:polysulfide reductase NrfD [Bacteroidales bacterium]